MIRSQGWVNLCINWRPPLSSFLSRSYRYQVDFILCSVLAALPNYAAKLHSENSTVP